MTGVAVSRRKHVARLMRSEGLRLACAALRCTTMSDHDQPVAANISSGASRRSGPISAGWATSPRSHGQGSSTCVILDFLSDGVVGALRANDRHLALRALEQRCGAAAPKLASCTHRSGQPYASEDTSACSRARHHLQHESGARTRHAAMESWFST